MKKFIGLIVLILLSVNLFAEKYESPMQIYKSNYFIAGDSEDQVKFQVSVKYNLIYPSETGLWVGYTQTAFWNLYDKSAPFTEFNHEPEVFYCFESKNNLFDLDTGVLDYIQLSPIHHKSNGVDGLDSRSINTYYGEMQLSVGQVYNFGIILKAFDYYNMSKKNKDIDDYTGNCEGEAFFQLKSASTDYFDKEKIYVRGGGNYMSEKGWVEGGIKVRIITTVFQPFLYAQVFHGYGESMIDYNKKDTAVRVGLIFE